MQAASRAVTPPRGARRLPSTIRAAAVVGLLVATACSGAPRPDSVAAGRPADAAAADIAATDAGSGATDTTADDGSTTRQGAPGAPRVDAGPSTDSTAGRAPGGAADTGDQPDDDSGGGTDGGGSGGTTGPTYQGFVADYYTGADDTRGITDDTITLCGHAALILAAAFNTSEEDLNVYWEKVNHEGGIYGRDVTLTWEDDSYNANQAVEAAKACRDEKPFMILGGIGFDQIPAVRNWAEENEELYLHHIAVSDDSKRFSFTAQPTVQEVGRAFGEYLVAHHVDTKLGIVHRNSPNWQPGYEVGRDVAEDHGIEITAAHRVDANKTIFTTEILDLKGKGTETVWIWDNALAAAEFIKQSHDQDFSPTFVVFPFQTTLDVLGDDAFESPIEGVGTWSAYKVGGYQGAFAYPEFGYQAELERFEAAMDEYRPGVTPNDILWQVWIGNKALHQAFLDCGVDCTRNKFAGMMLGGLKDTVPPNCPVDYARNPHKGGWSFITLEAFEGEDGNPWFRTTSWCREHLL